MASDNKRGRSGSQPIEVADDSDAGQNHEQPPSKRRRTSRETVQMPANALDHGEVANLSLNTIPIDASGPAQSSPPQGHAGWNEGVTPAGLRTSFGSKVKRAAEKKIKLPISQEGEATSNTIAVRDPAAEAASTGEHIVVRDQFDAAEPPMSRFEAKKRRRQAKKASKAAGGVLTASGEQEPSPVDASQPSPPQRKTRAQAIEAAEEIAVQAAVSGEQKRQQSTAPKQRSRRYKFDGQTWKLPPPPGLDWGPEEGRTWQFKFEQWAQDYVALNNSEKQLEILRDPKRGSLVLQDAYGRLQMSRDWRRKAVALMVDYKNQERLALLLSTIVDNLARGKSMSPQPPLAEAGVGAGDATDTLAKHDVPVMDADANSHTEKPAHENSSASRSPGEISEHTGDGQGDAEMDDAEDEAYRQRYYPGIAHDQVFCTLCASFGHRTTSCPEAKCRFCGDSDHMAPGCPTRQRCFKCKQLGHVKDDCQEKLALAPGEAMECAFCASIEHTESDCAEFFRTYRPSLEVIRTVKHIPIFCYCCGNEGHYGTQCGLNPAPTKTARVEIWSKENWQQYVDPNSSEEAIAWDSRAGGNAYAHDANGRPDFGKSIVPRTHIIFEDEEDEEDGGFIRPPVQRQQQQQQNKQNPQINVSRQVRGGFSSLAQQPYPQNPPLPPGPPPGLPARPPQSNGDGQQQRKRPRKVNRSQPNGGHLRGNGQQNGRGGGHRIRGGASRGGNRGGRR